MKKNKEELKNEITQERKEEEIITSEEEAGEDKDHKQQLIFKLILLDGNEMLHLSDNFIQKQRLTDVLCGIVQETSRLRLSMHVPLDKLDELTKRREEVVLMSYPLTLPVCQDCEFIAKLKTK
jgi:ssRNA-specific RNase YbeY (16S rRNA maturation enzyme)